ncbi:3-phosphoshikimate 1-carboxyvinyltransferase [Lachnoclostridium sp. Marseille-P6806]|uniref:3-phosphoshikimate 1-carboxyvinyltransferase n=1 Tax=Lachnoclostridium sp. Marseille-P6806 TaxID=2364793 RepID=UPI0010316783|nr:3-phosphoshikimate 1-carboxyvinyltransferase [Lachnoclostridium sp. Marseille-P6806]
MIRLQKAASPLRGGLSVPGDKSVSHRAVIFGALADGRTRIMNFLSGADCLSTIDCFRRLGIAIEADRGSGEVTVFGRGLHGLLPSSDPQELFTGNSGTTTRILCGVLAAQPFTTILSGDESICRRPMRRVIEPLTQMGAEIVGLRQENCAPLRISGSPLHGITWRSSVASAQVKSAVLCAGLYADGASTVIEPALSRDHSERMLQALGASVTTERREDGFYITIEPADRLSTRDIEVPGDISSAAYFITAALLVPGSELLLKNIGVNPTRSGILEVLRRMGGDITALNERNSGGEPVCDLLVRHSALHGTVIEGELIPTLIDELPVIAVAAAAAEGQTVIHDAAELRVKESDRIASVTENLLSMGCRAEAAADGMIIEGGRPLSGALIRCRDDHRIAMSFAVASLIAEGETTLDNERCVAISYPDFFADMASLRVSASHPRS